MSERGTRDGEPSEGAGRASGAGEPPVPRGDVPFARRVVIAVGIALLMLGVALFLRKSIYVLLLVFTAILVAVMLRGMAAWLAGKTRMPDGGALAVVVLAIVGFFILLGVLVAPSVVEQFERLADQLPRSVERAQERLRQHSWGRKVLGEGEQQQQPQQQPQQPQPSGEPAQAGQPAAGDTAAAPDAPATQPQPGNTVVAEMIDATTRPATVGRVAGYAKQVIEGLFTFLLVLIVGIYLAAQPRFYLEGTLKLFPARERPRLREVFLAVGHTLRWWLIGQLVPMVAIGILTAIGLKLIGVPLWLPLAILAALLNFIPNFGPIIASIPALLIALASDQPSDALWVAGLYVLAQNLEGYLIMPLVQRRAVEMPPALTIVSQVLLGLLLGPLGVVLAAPLTAAALVLIKMLYVEDTLGTRVEHANDEGP